jgi:hypothetical protein
MQSRLLCFSANTNAAFRLVQDCNFNSNTCSIGLARYHTKKLLHKSVSRTAGVLIGLSAQSPITCITASQIQPLRFILKASEVLTSITKNHVPKYYLILSDGTVGDDNISFPDNLPSVNGMILLTSQCYAASTEYLLVEEKAIF